MYGEQKGRERADSNPYSFHLVLFLYSADGVWREGEGEGLGGGGGGEK